MGKQNRTGTLRIRLDGSAYWGAWSTTQIYLHAHLALKERALARTARPGSPPGRCRPPDTLLAFLEGP